MVKQEIFPPEQDVDIEGFSETAQADEVIEPVAWVEKVKRLNDLRPFEQNPRRITKDQFEKLKASLLEDGYHARIKATRDGRVIGGHQRLRALRELGFKEVPVLIPSRDLSDREFVRIMVRDNHNNGVFDMDMMAGMFDLEELREFGLHDITGIAPMGDGEEKPPKAQVCCPDCGSVFPVKGNKA